ncbi:hypothetical protein F5144DRAFT_538610 [Chaetomium tenue]|uniref:Uncharacterized protein n=1 Tax=Chaetomium tenue TaxID=1854479 RepID=A0ACB7P0T6_9PEZI|nr:hypothetical protein F5144DRAFT_538610 [Chaetomium globosum]
MTFQRVFHTFLLSIGYGWAAMSFTGATGFLFSLSVCLGYVYHTGAVNNGCFTRVDIPKA